MSALRPARPVAFAAALAVWTRIALLSFGGPAGQIALMHRVLVDEKRWVGEARFLHALNYCMLLPGPEAQQLAIYLGWLIDGVRGGIVAGTLFILPGFCAILALSFAYAAFGSAGMVEGLLLGLKAAVLAVIVQALTRIARRTLANATMLAVAATAFVGIFALGIPFPLLIVGAALVGYAVTRAGGSQFQATGSAPSPSDADSALGAVLPDHARPGWRWSLRVCSVLAALWLVPVAALLATLGPADVFTRIALFFSQMAIVTFGGAYAVLAYVAQEAVQNYGWLEPGEMLDGLGMAEATPGPLIQVLQFVAFMGALRDPGALDPYLAATLAAILATWVTFVPSFLWVFLGAPHIERLRGNRALSGAMAAITAAVVGVMASLALWFALHVLFAEHVFWHGPGLRIEIPVLASLDLPALVLSGAALLAVLRLGLGAVPVILACSAAGTVLALLGLA